MSTTTSNRCRSCCAPVLWTITEAGERMPVDPDPVADGNLVLSVRLAGTDAEHLRSRAFAPLFDRHLQAHRFRSHFASCPNADQHRGPR